MQLKNQPELLWRRWTIAMSVECVGAFVLAFVRIILGNQCDRLYALGMATYILYFLFGSISGGHFTTIASIAHATAGSITWALCATYFVVHFIASLIGSVIAVVVVNSSRAHIFLSAPTTFNPAVNVFSAATVEMFYTALFCIVILFITRHPVWRNNDMYQLFIAIAFYVCLYAAFPFSGAALNPALVLAFAITSHADNNPLIDDSTVPRAEVVILYIIFQVVGAMLAGGAFLILTGKTTRFGRYYITADYTNVESLATVHENRDDVLRSVNREMSTRMRGSSVSDTLHTTGLEVVTCTNNNLHQRQVWID